MFRFREILPTLMPKERCLKGRDVALEPAELHRVLGSPMDLKRLLAEREAQSLETETIVLGMGCFWGAERRFYQLAGVVGSATGYAGGHTPNPHYEEVCSGSTAHSEVVRVSFDPTLLSLESILKIFWESHDATAGMRQGNDIGTQYRSAIYYLDEAQLTVIEASKAGYEQKLTEAGFGAITTEIAPLDRFYFAEDYHQQYLHQHPDGYCGLRGLGVKA